LFSQSTILSLFFLTGDVIDDQGNEIGRVDIRLPLGSPPNQLIFSEPLLEAETALDEDAFKSAIIEVSLSIPLPEGSFRAEICLDVDKEEDIDDLCLGLYDEQSKEWECEDECLKEKDDDDDDDDQKKLVCGHTQHFTNFAILLVGSSGVKGNRCHAKETYFTGDWRGDLGVAGGVALFFLLVAVASMMYSEFLRWKDNRELDQELSSKTKA